MRFNRMPPAAPAARCAPTKDGVLVLTGYGVVVSVERGHLAVRDGLADARLGGATGLPFAQRGRPRRTKQ